MKSLIFFLSLFFCLLGLTNCADNKSREYFTGELEYTYSYESNVLSVDSLAKERPHKGTFRYDLNDYQSRFIGQDTVTYYYSGNLNKCISESNSQRNYACEDYGVLTDSVFMYKLSETDEKILGYSCKILEMQKSNSWVKYYVSNELKIAPATYKKHRSYNWDIYGKKTEGGVILKSEHRFKNFVMKGVVTKIKAHSGDFSALEMGKNKMNEICNAKN